MSGETRGNCAPSACMFSLAPMPDALVMRMSGVQLAVLTACRVPLSFDIRGVR